MLTPNSAYIDDLYADFLHDPNSVGEEWRAYFQARKDATISSIQQQPLQATDDIIEVVQETPVHKQEQRVDQQSAQSKQETSIPLASSDIPEKLSSIGMRIASNMSQSRNVPTATSFRVIPVKALEENRRLINRHLVKNNKKKVSYTHILAWALVKALVKYPHMNDAFSVVDGIPHRIKRSSVNIGLAVDVTRKDGMRMLVVPSIKNSQAMTFSDFCAEYDGLISKARANKLTVDELSGASISLTNPGTIGTVSSVPRLMEGQGLIIATGSIEYPAEFQAVMPDVLSTLAISKVLTITSTYDHRIIQGAE
ncbi:MAG: 2-oxo acid dehydrogenase subunit E2, partial [Bacteroidota bacterium]